MATNSYGPKGQPQFSSGGAPEIDVDPTTVADYAALVGNAIVGTRAERLANKIPGPSGKPVWDGLIWQDTTDKITYRRTNGAWTVFGTAAMCVLAKSAQQTGIAGTTVITWGSATVDTHGFFTPATSTTQIRPPLSGLYRITIGITTTGVIARALFLTVNGALRTLGSAVGASGAASHVFATVIVSLQASDVVAFQVTDASAGLPITTGSWVSIELIG